MKAYGEEEKVLVTPLKILLCPSLKDYFKDNKKRMEEKLFYEK